MNRPSGVSAWISTPGSASSCARTSSWLQGIAWTTALEISIGSSREGDRGHRARCDAIAAASATVEVDRGGRRGAGRGDEADGTRLTALGALGADHAVQREAARGDRGFQLGRGLRRARASARAETREQELPPSLAAHCRARAADQRQVNSKSLPWI